MADKRGLATKQKQKREDSRKSTKLLKNTESLDSPGPKHLMRSDSGLTCLIVLHNVFNSIAQRSAKTPPCLDRERTPLSYDISFLFIVLVVQK